MLQSNLEDQARNFLLTCTHGEIAEAGAVILGRMSIRQFIDYIRTHDYREEVMLYVTRRRARISNQQQQARQAAIQKRNLRRRQRRQAISREAAEQLLAASSSTTTPKAFRQCLPPDFFRALRKTPRVSATSSNASLDWYDDDDAGGSPTKEFRKMNEILSAESSREADPSDVFNAQLTAVPSLASIIARLK